MGTFSGTPTREKIEGTVFTKIIRPIFHDGACQCNSDCDCYSKKGVLLFNREEFTYPEAKKYYSSLKACEQSYRSLGIM
jgi:hypothetical protein